MITVPELSAEALGSFLASHLGRRFSSTEAQLTELVPSVARLALECIGNSDALYHNVEHTMLVTLVGYDIMKGRALLTPTRPGDFAHVLVSCMLHDIGYVRGILKGDGPDGYVVDAQGRRATLPRGSSDAALLQYDVDRSKLFVMDRIGSSDFWMRKELRVRSSSPDFQHARKRMNRLAKRAHSCAQLTLLGSWAILNICGKPMLSTMNSRKSA